MDRVWEIYTLIDPRNLRTRYVGFTTQGDQRLKRSPETRAKMSAAQKMRWIKQWREDV